MTIQTQEIDRLNFTIKRLMEEINIAEVKANNQHKELQHQTQHAAHLQ